MKYNKQQLDEFLNSIEISDEKKDALKNLFEYFLEETTKEEFTPDSINNLLKVNKSYISANGHLNDFLDSFKEIGSEFFNIFEEKFRNKK